jgi:CPA2 family monovalent cation:H+ antiporter-2
MESFLFQASLYLGAAVVLVPLAVRLGLGSVLGYLAAGILLGPVFGLAGAETTELQHIAEFGVVMMLFLIGLELEPRVLWDMRKRLLGLGGTQVALTAVSIAGISWLLGQTWQTSVVIGMLLSLSSTAIVLQTLTEKGLMRSPGGRASFAVLLTQDMAVIPMLALIPLLTLPGILGPSAETFGITNTETGVEVETEASVNTLLAIVQALPGWAEGLLMLAIVGVIVLAGHFLSRPVFRFVHASRLPEMSTFISLLMVLGIAFLMIMVGLSPALGTFVAGVVLANSEFRHQIEADIKPFKGLLLGLFFMTVGIGINFDVLARSPATIIALTVAVILVKAIIMFGIAIFSGLKGKDRFLFTLGLAQAGEFGFLLISVARSEGALAVGASQKALLVISLSMLVTPLLYVLYDRLARFLPHGGDSHQPDQIDAKGRVIIAGVGRFGQTVNRLARSARLSTVVLDSDMAMIETLRRFGIKGFYGDPSRPELLEAAGLKDAEVLVVAVDDRDNALRIVAHARRVRPDLHIVARARDRVHVYELYQAGANDIVRETFDSSVRAGRYVLENTGFSEYEASQMSQTFWRIDRAAMRDMAELWVPGQPLDQNPEYITRVRQLERDLESALFEELESGLPARTAAE